MSPATTTPLVSSTLSPKSNTRRKPWDGLSVKISDLPGAMDKMGWLNSAKIMRHWFSNPGWEMTSADRAGGVDYVALKKNFPQRINDQIIKITWVVNTPRVQSVFNDLCQNWASPKAVDRLVRVLLPAQGWQPGGFCQLGHNLGVQLTDAVEMDGVCDINARPIGRYTDVLDDFYGAIFKATLKMAVIGTAHYDAKRGQDIFEVHKLGVYLRDTYDFNSAWWEDSKIGLGVWSKDRMLSKSEMATYLPLHKILVSSAPGTAQWISAALAMSASFPGFTKITNGDFREYRDKFQKGGDFYVFTDVKWVNVNVKEIVLP